MRRFAYLYVRGRPGLQVLDVCSPGYFEDEPQAISVAPQVWRASIEGLLGAAPGGRCEGLGLLRNPCSLQRPRGPAKHPFNTACLLTARTTLSSHLAQHDARYHKRRPHRWRSGHLRVIALCLLSISCLDPWANAEEQVERGRSVGYGLVWWEKEARDQ